MFKYADEDATRGASQRRRRIRLFRLGGWSVMLEKEHVDDVVFVSPEEFARLEECTTNPAHPTQAALEGAELLRTLHQNR